MSAPAMADATVPPPVRRPPAPSGAARGLLGHARDGLREANETVVTTERYAAAHLSALRIAAAVLAARTQPADRRRGRPLSAWVLLQAIAPELSEWATFFAAGADKRAAAEAGLAAFVSARDADDLVRQTWIFLELVERILGVSCGAPVRRPASAVAVVLA